MKLTRLALLTCVLSASALAQKPGRADATFDWFNYDGHDSIYKVMKAGPGEYLNPIFAGFYPDPSITRHGDDYYAVTSSFTYFPGVPIFHSKDLVHWTQIGHVLDRPSQLQVGTQETSQGIFAPAITVHKDTFYMITTVATVGNFYVTATNPAGPWSEPNWLPEVSGKDGFDPSLFFDDDGKAYVINNGPPDGPPLYNGHRAIWMQELDLGTKKMVGLRKIIVNGGVDISRKPVWIEAPHIFKKDGKYYLICAEGGTAEAHSEVVARADNVNGPYIPFAGNPILTQRHLDPRRPFPIAAAGHADFVETQNGEWWAIFLGDRPYEGQLFNTGRETFMLPVRWENGWPIMLTGNDVVPYVNKRPNLPVQPAPKIPLTGNFTLKDEFDGKTLPYAWMGIRTANEPFYALTGGAVTLEGRPFKLGTRTQVSFLGRRQQHAWATASTVMHYAPRKAGDEAGLVAFQSDDYFYFLGVALVGGKPTIQLVERAGPRTKGESTVIASAPLDVRAGAPIYLKIDAKGKLYDFSYGTAVGKWTVLKADADGSILSTAVAGGFSKAFVGTMFGLYAYSPE